MLWGVRSGVRASVSLPRRRPGSILLWCRGWDLRMGPGFRRDSEGGRERGCPLIHAQGTTGDDGKTGLPVLEAVTSRWLTAAAYRFIPSRYPGESRGPSSDGAVGGISGWVPAFAGVARGRKLGARTGVSRG